MTAMTYYLAYVIRIQCTTQYEIRIYNITVAKFMSSFDVALRVAYFIESLQQIAYGLEEIRDLTSRLIKD